VNLARDRQDHRCESNVLDSIITSVSINLDASLSIKVVSELQLTIEAILRAAADPITDKRHIPYQIIISWSDKLHDLYITLFLLLSAAIVVTLRLNRTRKPLLRASCADTFMT